MFEICNNMVENLIFALFISSCLHIKTGKNSYIIITVLMNTIISTILTSLNIIGLTQTAVIQFVFCFGLYLVRKQILLQDIVVSIYCNILLYMSVYFSVIFFGFVSNTNPMGVFEYFDLYYASIFLSKSLFIILCYISYKKEYVPLFDFKDKRLNIVLVFEVLLIMIMAFYFVQTVATTSYNNISNIIYLCFVLLFITFYVFVKEYINVNNKLQTQDINLQKEKYIKENIKNLKRIKDEIDTVEHRLSYVLHLIEYEIEQKNYQEAKNKIKHSKELLSKVEAVLHTGNELFDFMINMEIKQIFMKGKRIKICSLITVNNAYNHFDIYNPIIELIQLTIDEVDFTELYLSELDDQCLEIKMFFEVHDEKKDYVFSKLRNYNNELKLSCVGDIIIAILKKDLYANY